MIKIHSEIKDEIFGSPKKFFLPTKSFRVQGKSFRYRPKENFDTCLRSVGLIFTEIWPFSWKQTFWSSNFFWQFLTLFSWVKLNGSHRKWHNSENMRSSDLGQASKFSLGRYLKLFLWHPKNLASRKNVLGRPKKKLPFFLHTLYFTKFILKRHKICYDSTGYA